MILKPWFLLLVILDVALWVAAICWPAWRVERGPMSVVVGVWPGSETIVTAGDKGMLPDTEVNLVEMIWSSAAVRAFENRVADVAVLGMDDVLHLMERGADVRVILVFDFSTSADVILGKPGITRVQDLRGKKIGVSTRSSGMYLLRTVLEDADMTTDELSQVPVNAAEAETAFAEGELDAAVTSEPWSTRMMAQGGAVRIADSSRVPGDICRLLVVRKGAERKYRSALQALVNAHFALLKSFQSMSATDSSFAAVAQREGVTMEELVGIFHRISMQDLAANRALLDREHGTLAGTVSKIAAYMLGHEMMKRPVDCSRLVDPSFVLAVP